MINISREINRLTKILFYCCTTFLVGCSQPTFVVETVVVEITSTPEPSPSPTNTPEPHYGPTIESIQDSLVERGLPALECNARKFEITVPIGSGSGLATIELQNDERNCEISAPFLDAVILAGMPQNSSRVYLIGDWIRDSMSDVVQDKRTEAQILVWLDDIPALGSSSDVIGDYHLISEWFLEGFDYIGWALTIENLLVDEE